MTVPLITENFLLQTDAARELYHQYAKELPIIDFHSHLPPAQVAEDHRYENLSQIWLNEDHYKWRLMRACGVEERFCTGDAPDREKFQKWAEVVPQLLRNPLYHWTHMELNRPFGIDDRLLNPETAQGIWDETCAKLARPEFSCRGILKQFNVRVFCTTDDPVDSLEHHKKVAGDASFSIQMLPAWRAEKAIAVDKPAVFKAWVDKLAEVADLPIMDFDSFLAALRKRHDFFHEMGCRVSDCGPDTAYGAEYGEDEIREIFDIVRAGQPLRTPEIVKMRSALLHEFGLMDAEKGWTQQYHFGPIRNLNTRMYEQLGPDKGFDSMADLEIAKPLAAMLDRLNRKGKLAKTIIYNLYPAHTAVIATMLGNFQDGITPGKMQLGAAWWYQDTKDGIERQLGILSNMGVLSQFVGMLTDSRSFLSFNRHEYFRRILCNLLGNDIEQGLLPRDMSLVGKLVQDVCYNNAARYFGFRL